MVHQVKSVRYLFPNRNFCSWRSSVTFRLFYLIQSMKVPFTYVNHNGVPFKPDNCFIWVIINFGSCVLWSSFYLLFYHNLLRPLIYANADTKEIMKTKLSVLYLCTDWLWNRTCDSHGCRWILSSLLSTLTFPLGEDWSNASAALNRFGYENLFA